MKTTPTLGSLQRFRYYNARFAVVQEIHACISLSCGLKDERKVSRSAQNADHLIGPFFGSKKATDGSQEQRRRYNHNKEV
jgi:hypothetical protein